MKNQMSIKLAPDRLDPPGDQSLGELLKQACRVTRPNLHESDHVCEARWIARWAVRAVCEEIIRTGEITLPLAVIFARRKGPGVISVEIPVDVIPFRSGG
jgi:hypothetical protein